MVKMYAGLSIATLLAAALFVFIPITVSIVRDESPKSITVQPSVVYGTPELSPQSCALVGISVSYNYRGFPFMSFGSDNECASKTLYPAGIALNVLLAATLMTIVGISIKKGRKL